MNKQEREKIQDIIDELTFIQEAEQEKYDNSPENLQTTERVEKYAENADAIQEAIEILMNIIED